ncbi:amidohydrolase [Oceanisphaera psychrotolerans]|uniref:N-acyl-L-amino acid amidohydrolase n=1 Tax=Oceanisphaera psychrotolerans TaxID=1414654 RepID=A0A1J4Q9V6_9GAMM|nr:amidohydrolase [Oceanisphaera psychrotolerans]OIN04833.1 N-acyl-L-amino acid amidohydrolase [Oceanisphaera psychrotolerans]
MTPRTARTLLASALAGLMMSSPLQAADAPLTDAIQQQIDTVMPRVVDWRRDIHQHPELGNREHRTAGLVADHLTSLGLEVRTGIAYTGVVGILRGAQPGPVVALRADMDALPVTEEVDLPFASKVRTTYNGEEVGVAHACGHDNHVAILMGVAQVLAAQKEQLTGTVLFVFQPAEEGAPEGEEGGAELMLKEGLFADIRPDAMFGLHVMPAPVGTIAVRTESTMASSDSFSIKVHGKQTHGGMPWAGVDPIVVSSQIVLGLQTIVSRQLDATRSPSVISLGAIHGGVRSNIIPEEVEMQGTIRTFSEESRTQIHQRMTQTAAHIAESTGARAEVTISPGYPVTVNDTQLTEAMMPTLRRVAGDKLQQARLLTASEDFAFFAQQVPSMYFFLGAAPDNPELVYPNHSPKFYADERALPIGVTAMTALTLDYLQQQASR